MEVNEVLCNFITCWCKYITYIRITSLFKSQSCGPIRKFEWIQSKLDGDKFYFIFMSLVSNRNLFFQAIKINSFAIISESNLAYILKSVTKINILVQRWGLMIFVGHIQSFLSFLFRNEWCFQNQNSTGVESYKIFLDLLFHQVFENGGCITFISKFEYTIISTNIWNDRWVLMKFEPFYELLRLVVWNKVM